MGPKPLSDMSIRKCFRLVGGSLLAVGCMAALYLYLFPNEKDAIYLFGHWVDITWELLIPGASLGLLLFLFSRSERMGSGDKS